MKIIKPNSLLKYIINHLQTFVPVDLDINKDHSKKLEEVIQNSIEDLYKCFANNFFLSRCPLNIFDVRVYSIFLIIIGRNIYEYDPNSRLADRVYLLNRYLHGCDIYHKVAMPKEFFLNYAKNIVLVNTHYGNKLVVYHGVTVVAMNGKIPIIGDEVIIMPNCIISGNSIIGSRVTISSGVRVINQNIPDNTLVFQAENGRDLFFKENSEKYISNYFFKD